MEPINKIAPFLKAPRRMRTVGDAIRSIIVHWSCLPRELRTKNSPSVWRQRRAGEFLTEIDGRIQDEILLAEAVDMETGVIRQALSHNLSPQDAVQYACDLRSILTHARKNGWTCRAVAVRHTWVPIENALRPTTEGCLQISLWAGQHGITSDQMREKHLEAWKQSAMKEGLSEDVADDRLKRFRRKIRRAGLAHLVPHLDLISKRRPSFILGRDVILPGAIPIELADIMNFKTAAWIPGRRYEIAVSACTGDILFKRFRQLLGFLFLVLGIKGIKSLLQAVTEPYFDKYITFLEARGLLRESIGHLILPIHSVLREHALFRGQDYGWMLKRLRKVPKELPQMREQRKEDKFVPFSELALIPKKLRALSRGPGLTAIEIAWYRHDELFWTLLLNLPLRLRNLRECGIQLPANRNLYHEKITPRMRNDLKLPDWVQAALKTNPVEKFYLLKFGEDSMKARRAETKFVPLLVVPLLVEYLAIHRKEIIRDVSDPGNLFLSRRRGALSEQAARRIVTHLSRENGKRIAPHLVRDVVSDECLKCGGTIEDVQDKLTHVDFETSWIYSRLNNTERGIDALNLHFSSPEYNNLT